jgi:hypothetical protein
MPTRTATVHLARNYHRSRHYKAACHRRDHSLAVCQAEEAAHQRAKSLVSATMAIGELGNRISAFKRCRRTIWRILHACKATAPVRKLLSEQTSAGWRMRTRFSEKVAPPKTLISSGYWRRWLRYEQAKKSMSMLRNTTSTGECHHCSQHLRLVIKNTRTLLPYACNQYTHIHKHNAFTRSASPVQYRTYLMTEESKARHRAWSKALIKSESTASQYTIETARKEVPKKVGYLLSLSGTIAS